MSLVSAAPSRLIILKAERLQGGKEIARALLGVVRTELSMASRHVEPAKTNAIEGELLAAEAETENQDYADARERLAQTLSRVTTVSNEYIKVLMDADFI